MLVARAGPAALVQHGKAWIGGAGVTETLAEAGPQASRGGALGGTRTRGLILRRDALYPD